jgi:uncharacterized protein YkwD
VQLRRHASLIALVILPMLVACDTSITSSCGEATCATPITKVPATTGTTGTTSAVTLTGDLKTIVDLTNVERAKKGLPPLSANAKLITAAMLTTEQLVSTGILAHVMPGTTYPAFTDRINAAGYRWTSVGENLGGGVGATATQMVAAWVASPFHYDNMVSPGFTEIGVAIQTAPNGTIYMAQEFGHP